MQASKASTSENSAGSDKKLTVVAAAARLGLQPVTLRAWASRRKISFHKLGRAIRIPESEVERILRESLIPALDR